MVLKSSLCSNIHLRNLLKYISKVGETIYYALGAYSSEKDRPKHVVMKQSRIIPALVLVMEQFDASLINNTLFL